MEQELCQQVVARPPGTPWAPLTLTRCLLVLPEIPLLCRTEFFTSTAEKEKERPSWYFSFPAADREVSALWLGVVPRCGCLITSVGESVHSADDAQHVDQ